MKLLPWLSGASSERAQTKSEALIRRVITTFGLPVIETEQGVWCVTAEPQNSYRVGLFMWAEGPQIVCTASAGMSIERDLIPRELLLQILEENSRLSDGGFRLVPQDEHRLVALARVIDTRTFPEKEIKHLGETLIERMQRMIGKLYGMGLIISGPATPKNDQPSEDV